MRGLCVPALLGASTVSILSAHDFISEDGGSDESPLLPEAAPEQLAKPTLGSDRTLPIHREADAGLQRDTPNSQQPATGEWRSTSGASLCPLLSVCPFPYLGGDFFVHTWNGGVQLG